MFEVILSQILQEDGRRFVILYGSNGTGKTIVLFQCFIMQLANLKLRGKKLNALVLVGTDSIKDPICGTGSLKHGLQYCGTADCDGPELLYDLKTKYLQPFELVKHIVPTTFEKACKSKC